MNEKAVNFLCYENINSGLFKSQVIAGAIALKESDKSLSVTISVFIRPSHLIKYLDLRKYLLENYEIKLFIAGPLLPLRFIGSASYSKYLIAIISMFVMVNQLIVKSTVSISRGYIASAGLAKMNQTMFIFDPRSIWHLENTSAGLIKIDSESYYFWRALEFLIVEKSKCILVVSEAMKNYFKDLGKGKKIYFVPILTHHNAAGKDSEAVSTYECGYVGSLGLNNVNHAALSSLIDKLIFCGVRKFLFLTNEPASNVWKLFRNPGLVDIKIKSVEPFEICMELSSCRFGIHALPNQLDAETRMGTKVLEYWNAGIPVVVNENVGAAAMLISKNPFLGAVIGHSDVLTGLCKEELEQTDNVKIKNFHSHNFGLHVWLKAIHAALK